MMDLLTVSCSITGTRCHNEFLELKREQDKFVGKYQEGQLSGTKLNPKKPYRCFELEEKEVMTILKILNAPMKPMPWEADIGFDGTFYCLSIQNGYSEMIFKWWVEAPKQWRGAENVLNKLMSLAKP